MNLRTFRPAYMFRRLRQIRFCRQYPDAPWLSEPAVLLLRSYLRPTDAGLEWGSGRSTLWFARRVKHLISIEHDPAWHRSVADELKRAGCANKVDHRHIPCGFGETDEPDDHPYVQPARQLPDESLDFALVDGLIRELCMSVVLPKIKPGGLLVLDNANRFVPNSYEGRPTTVHEPRWEARSEKWRQILVRLNDWRRLHTTDGIWDTRFWIKPCA